MAGLDCEKSSTSSAKSDVKYRLSNLDTTIYW